MSSSWNPDEMSPEVFCDMIIAENIGGYGKDIFAKRFYKEIEKLKLQ